MNKNFAINVAHLINSQSLENGSNTPDYILGDFLASCLEAFETAIKARDKHNNQEITPQPSKPEPGDWREELKDIICTHMSASLLNLNVKKTVSVLMDNVVTPLTSQIEEMRKENERLKGDQSSNYIELVDYLERYRYDDEMPVKEMISYIVKAVGQRGELKKQND